MNVEWLPTAERSREDQLAYIGKRNPRAAIDMGDAIERAVVQLTDHPAVGRPGRVAGTRELVVGGTPYVLIYRIETAGVVVLRLLHGAQQWPREP